MNGWEIKGLLYQCNARTNDEYKVELEKRKRMMKFILLLGMLTLDTLVVIARLKPELLENRSISFVSGVCVGLIVGGLVEIYKIRKTINNEAALKEARLTETDEREKAISSKAIHTTIKIMFLSIYLLILLCSVVTADTVTILFLLLCIFVLSYLISRKIYSQRM